MSKPVFTREGPDLYRAAYAQYARYARPGTYRTNLTPADEARFRQWVSRQHIPFAPNAKVSDYDMRGWWAANGRPLNVAHEGHFPDTFKTPYDTTFSGESRYARPGTPLAWRGSQLLNTQTGQVMFAPAPGQNEMSLLAAVMGAR